MKRKKKNPESLKKTPYRWFKFSGKIRQTWAYILFPKCDPCVALEMHSISNSWFTHQENGE